MLTEKLFGATKLPLLHKSLDAYSLRHRAIADNISNIMTPGYQRKEVEFEEKLQAATKGKAMSQTNDKHIGHRGVNFADLNAELKIDRELSDINELNNVDIDAEMTDMAQNQLKFSFASQMSKLYFQLLQTSIRGA